MMAEAGGQCADLPTLHYVITAIFQGLNLLLTTWLARYLVANERRNFPRSPVRRGSRGP